MHRRSVVTAIAAGFAVGVVAVAGRAAPPASAVVIANLDTARSAALDGRFDDALRAIDAVRRELALARGLVIEAAAATLGPHRGLGVWEPVPGGVVPGRTLHLTLEVDGVTPKAERDGRFRHELDVTARFIVLADSGEEVLGDKPLGRHSVVSRRALPLQVVGAEMALGDKAPPGDYAADVTVVDVANGRTATRRVMFRLTP
jgi:hypothetical protein